MLDYYRHLLYDDLRIEAFRKAITTLVNNDTVVAEIGFGLGTYSFFAAMSGARKIYAMENAAIFAVGKELARRNRLAEKITFFNDHSKNVTLPEKVDYIIMEDYPPLFLFPGLMDTLSDARERFLKPTGKFIPNDFQLKFAPVEYPEFFQTHRSGSWKNDRVYGIDWEYLTELMFNKTHSVSGKKLRLLSRDIPLVKFDLITCRNVDFHFSDKITIDHDGTLHGLAGWWDCWFTPDHFFSNSPLAPANTWGQLFFPIRYPVTVKKGDLVDVELHSYQSRYSGDVNYRWSVKFHDTGQDYNTFISKIGSKEFLQKFNPEKSVHLNQDGLIAQTIFKHLQQKMTFKALAKVLCQKYPSQFPNEEQALVRIYDVLGYYI
ncbi:MAG: hypothetical protein ACP5FZ_11790 [Fidelibacterota bacterium]